MAKRVIYPKDKRIELDGGLNNKFERSIIQENESQDCLNVTFSNGAVATRQGTTSLTVSGVGSVAFDGFFTRKDNSGAETMICWSGGTMRTLDSNTFVTIGSAQSVYTPGKNVNETQYENHVFVGNGTEIPYKYNGADFTRHGVYPANSGTTASTASVAGNLNGDYQWKVTYVNSQLVEGDVSPAVATFTTVNEKVTLTGLPLGPQSFGVASRRIYRTVASGTTFKRVAEIADNTTTDLVRAFGLVQNALVAFGDESYTFIYMPDTTPGNWQVVPGDRDFGCKSPRGLFNFENKLMFPAIKNDKFVGFAALSANGIVPNATFLTVLNSVSELQSSRIEPDIFTFNTAKLANISAITYKNKAYISVPYGISQSTNNRIYQFDFSFSNVSKKQEFSWAPWTGLNTSQFTILDGSLYYDDSTGGHVFEMEDGTYNDNGVAIDSYIWTKEFSGAGSDINFFKDFTHAYILAETPGNWDMNFVIRVDSDDDEGETLTVDLNPGGSLWGTFVWGVDPWSAGKSQDEFTVFLFHSGKRVQFKLSNQNTVDQWFKVQGLGFRYNRKGLR